MVYAVYGKYRGPCDAKASDSTVIGFSEYHSPAGQEEDPYKIFPS